ncbi:Cationic amino acid transporter 3 [Nymphaea thermarum]|nr:Cationic amino acid transporter 3 [Nymphaea thermarum]
MELLVGGSQGCDASIRISGRGTVREAFDNRNLAVEAFETVNRAKAVLEANCLDVVSLLSGSPFPNPHLRLPAGSLPQPCSFGTGALAVAATAHFPVNIPTGPHFIRHPLKELLGDSGKYLPHLRPSLKPYQPPACILFIGACLHHQTSSSCFCHRPSVESHLEALGASSSPSFAPASSRRPLAVLSTTAAALPPVVVRSPCSPPPPLLCLQPSSWYFEEVEVVEAGDLIYVLVVVLVGLVPYYAMDPDTPISSAFSSHGMQWTVYVITAGAITALCATLLGSILPQASSSQLEQIVNQ